MRRTHWIALLTATTTLLLTSAAVTQTPPLASLVITPSTGMTFSGPQGGPFSPPFVQYSVSASIGTISYSIRTPSWLTASSTSGRADTGGVTITLRVDAGASRLRPGAYGPGVAFTNLTNGRGSATRPATLTIQAPAHHRR
jgi:hypothetical protein